jgi:hypothetical protein
MLAVSLLTVTPGWPQDLTLANFFSAGWNEEWAKRPHESRAPDMALLRVQTNFLEREFRTNYAFEDEINSRKRRSLGEVEALIAYGLNRRFMLEVVTTYDKFATRRGPDEQGALGRSGQSDPARGHTRVVVLPEHARRLAELRDRRPPNHV